MLGKIFEYALVAGTPRRLPGGSYLRVMTANSDLTLTFFDESGQPIGEWVGVLGGWAIDAKGFEEKLGIRSARFGSVQVETTVNQTVEIAVSRVPVFFDRLTGTITTTQASGATIDSVTDVTLAASATTAVVAANSNRRAVMIHNPVANTSTMRVGDSGAGASNGIPLPPGSTITLETQAAVYAYNPGAGAQDVAVLALLD